MPIKTFGALKDRVSQLCGPLLNHGKNFKSVKVKVVEMTEECDYIRDLTLKEIRSEGNDVIALHVTEEK